MALVSCLYLNSSLNNGLLKKATKNLSFTAFLKMVNIQQF